MPHVKVLVSVADEYLQRFTEVLDQLTEAGMAIERENRAIGVISGSIDANHISKIRSLEGVATVEESRQIQLPSPDNKVQ